MWVCWHGYKWSNSTWQNWIEMGGIDFVVRYDVVWLLLFVTYKCCLNRNCFVWVLLLRQNKITFTNTSRNGAHNFTRTYTLLHSDDIRCWRQTSKHEIHNVGKHNSNYGMAVQMQMAMRKKIYLNILLQWFYLNWHCHGSKRMNAEINAVINAVTDTWVVLAQELMSMPYTLPRWTGSIVLVTVQCSKSFTKVNRK